MKKLLKSPLCVLAMGTTFFYNSEAAYWSQLPGNIVISDENGKYATMGLPDAPKVLLESVRILEQFSWQGGIFKIYFLDVPVPQDVLNLELRWLPEDLVEQMMSIIKQNEQNYRNKYFEMITEANQINNKRSQLLKQIEKNKQELQDLAEEFNNKVNSDENIKNCVKILLNNEEFSIDNIKIIEDPQDQNNFAIKFNVLEQTKDINNTKYYKYLTDSKQQLMDLNNALSYQFSNMTSPPQ